MSFRQTVLVVILLVLAGLVFSAVIAPQLPERVPSHWDAAGEINGYSSREQALWFMPVMVLALAAMMLGLPMLDPLRKNIDSFRPAYHWMVIGTTLFMEYLHVLTLLAGTGVQVNMSRMMIPAISLLLVGIGFVIEKAKPNWFIGIRTPWTLSSPTVWEKTHCLGAKTMKISGLVSLLGFLVPAEGGFYVSIAVITLGSLIPVAASYIYYQAEQKDSAK